MRVAVTGANGFVGSALCDELERRQIAFVALVRAAQNDSRPYAYGQIVEVKNFSQTEELKAVFKGCTSVVHLAAKVHKPKEDDFQSYLDDNVGLTRQVLEAAHSSDVPHFVFLSTVKVFGEFQEDAFSLNAPCRPLSPYGVSKLQAEDVSKSLCQKWKMSLDILRIPLVVGGKAKGNLGTVAKFLKWGLPLPLGALRNRRSFVKLSTLVTKIVSLCEEREKINEPQTWVHAVAEPQCLSTPDLLTQFASEKGFQIRFVKAPRLFLQMACFALDFIQTKKFSRPPSGLRSSDKLMGDAVLIPDSMQVK